MARIEKSLLFLLNKKNKKILKKVLDKLSFMWYYVFVNKTQRFNEGRQEK